MSNRACADLYNSIIEDVIVESRQDFENAGIDEQTLQDLRDIWRQKLMASKVAKFGWVEEQDDVEDSSKINDENVKKTNIVKNEEEDDDDDDDDNVFGDIKGPTSGTTVTSSAATSTSNPSGLAVPGFNQNDGIVVPTTNATHKPSKPTSVTFSIRNNQLDGSFDFSFDEDDDINRKRSTNNEDEEDDDDDDDDDLGSDLGADSDAINSDLDDSDDEDDEDGDGEGEDADGEGAGNDIEQNIMLCLYDRVQRVRNRWKCSLKDGLMNINGKDYVFQKATGDSEW